MLTAENRECHLGRPLIATDVAEQYGASSCQSTFNSEDTPDNSLCPTEEEVVSCDDVEALLESTIHHDWMGVFIMLQGRRARLIRQTTLRWH